MTTIDHVIAIVSDLAPAARDIGPETLLTDLALDSLECIDLTVAIEDEFDVDITCGERVSFESIGDIAALVDSKRSGSFALAA